MNSYGAARLSTIWDSLRTSYWFVPSVMAVATLLLWLLVHSMDSTQKEPVTEGLQWVYSGGPEGARELLGVIAGSMISVTSVTFSITIVALVLASQQFGPFLLRNFLRDRGDQMVLGTFISNFIFSLLTLRMIRGPGSPSYVPHLCVTVSIMFTLISIGVLIYFIHHVAVSIQAPYIIDVVSAELEKAIDRFYPDPAGSCAERELEGGELQGLDAGTIPPGGAGVAASGAGYLKAVDQDLLMRAAVQHDLVVWLLKRPGDYVVEGDLIASLPGGNAVSPELRKLVNEAFVLGAQRTATQDLLFVCDQIAEVAVRALSPGINDPFTAIICIDHLGQGLRRMAGRARPSACRRGHDGRPRLVAYPVTFPEMLDTSFNQIRHYGSSNPAILRRLLRAVASVVPYAGEEEDRQALLRHAVLIREAGRTNLREQEAREVAEEYAAVARIFEKRRD